MFHSFLVGFRITQCITELGNNFNMFGNSLGESLTIEQLEGFIHIFRRIISIILDTIIEFVVS